MPNCMNFISGKRFLEHCDSHLGDLNYEVNEGDFYSCKTSWANLVLCIISALGGGGGGGGGECEVSCT